MDKYQQELDNIEQLSEAVTPRSFFISSVDIFEASIEDLVQRVFRKDDHAVKYAVEPLLNNSGPLGELDVRLKLLYALGIISQDIYQDIDKFIQLRNFLNQEASEYHFTDSEIIEPIKTLHEVKNMGVVQLDIAPPADDAELSFYRMQIARQEQVVRSTLSLVVAAICRALHADNPLL
ncbi:MULTISPECIES: MltR family transcriptional regulator [unclassified Agarivorans]|uniref:MltR family transcriptional regulator n=1 Tax=unclassified Agarivorans TaxID=2636026 RepID=UPI003D7ECEF4